MHNCPSLVQARRTSQRGLTLVELLAVVAIVGILSAVGITSVRRYVASSKMSEAIHMIGLIKSAQETFKDETFTYLNVSSGPDDFYPKNPLPGQMKMNFPGNAPGATGWQTLAIHEDAPMLFVYSCTAGDAAKKPETGTGITVANWPSAALGKPWYVVKAKADLRGDGISTVFLSSSFAGEIFSVND